VFPLLAKRTTLSANVVKPLLHWAAERGYTRGHHSLLTLVQRLRHGGANINHVHHGHTPLTMAIKHGHEHIVAELVDAGAKQVVAGVPPALHLAVKYAVTRDTAVVISPPRKTRSYLSFSFYYQDTPGVYSSFILSLILD
jgi:ankyrin repeat protein